MDAKTITWVEDLRGVHHAVRSRGQMWTHTMCDSAIKQPTEVKPREHRTCPTCREKLKESK